MEYLVQDQYEDPIQPTDSWGRFLSMRYRERRDFYDSLPTTEQQLVWKELQRIEYFRDHFKERKLSETDHLSLDLLLEEARNVWNVFAFERCECELAKCQNVGNRNYQILRAVQQRGGVAISDADFSISSEKEEFDLANYDPDEPDFGYNGWLMEFADGRRPVDNPRCYGEFPHQKLSIRQLLYNRIDTPLIRMENKDQLRYFHLPANNMAWVEVSHTTAA
jgi:hypothetical protein